MKIVLYLFLLLTCFLAGCASSRSVLCVVPQGSFKPATESELLSEINSQIPFAISPKNMISKQKSGRLVGWVVVRNDKQKNVLKAKLKNSETLKILQVESLTPEFKALMKSHAK